MLVFCCIAAWAQMDTTLLRNTEKVARTLYYIQNSYLDTVDLDSIVDKMLDGLVEQLDPHSVYIPRERVSTVNEPLDGSFEGVGVEFAIIGDTLTIQSVVAGGPSEAAGIRSGDKFVEVDGENIAGVGLTAEKVRSLLRGPKGSKVKVGVLREGTVQEFSIRRDTIPLESIDASYSFDSGIVYMKVSRFAQKTALEFVDALRKLSPKRPPRGMIIDLRGNGGGFMHAAVMMADIFLEKGQLIVRTEGPGIDKSDEASGRGFYKKGPVVIIVDENSASASEILAGALQDWDRAVIVGRRTFGKGLVQQQYDLPDGSEVRLTVARYHTPSGRVLQTPYVEGQREAYFNESRDRYARGESFSRDSIRVNDSLMFSTLKLGRPVYGGGGIIPDVFIPYDTIGVNRYMMRAIGSGWLTEYTDDYGDKNRSRLMVGDFDSYEKLWKKIGQEVFDGMVAYCSSKGLTAEEGELDECEKYLKIRLKAQLARIPFGLDGYWQVVNNEWDPAFQRAIEIVKAWKGDFPDGL